jgi:hypothetical protein
MGEPVKPGGRRGIFGHEKILYSDGPNYDMKNGSCTFLIKFPHDLFNREETKKRRKR